MSNSDWRRCRNCGEDLFDLTAHLTLQASLEAPNCVANGEVQNYVFAPSALVEGMVVQLIAPEEETSIAAIGTKLTVVSVDRGGGDGVMDMDDDDEAWNLAYPEWCTVTRLHPGALEEVKTAVVGKHTGMCRADDGHRGDCRPYRTLSEGPREGDRMWIWEPTVRCWKDADVPFNDDWPRDQGCHAPERPTHVPQSVRKNVDGAPMPESHRGCKHDPSGRNRPMPCPFCTADEAPPQTEAPAKHPCCGHPVNGDRDPWDHYGECQERYRLEGHQRKAGLPTHPEGPLAVLHSTVQRHADYKPPGPVTTDLSDDYDLLADASDDERRTLPTKPKE
jgi:hypothetical protein